MSKDLAIKAIYLFHADCPKGEMFKFKGGEDSPEYKAMIEKGWVDSPARLDLPEDNDTGIPMEKAENATPEQLVGLVKSYGFIVLTQEQLKAEAVKMSNVALDIENFADSDIIAEAERRGLKEPAPSIEEADIIEGISEDLDALSAQFDEEPESLTIDELVMLGNTIYKLGLRSNMKEKTLIDKINEAKSGE